MESDPLLRIEEARCDLGLLLRLKGELDLSTAPILSDRLRAASAANESVVLDLGELDFVDSTGLRLFIAACLGAKRDGWSVGLRNPREHIRRTFEVAGLDGSLFFDD